MSKSIVKKLNLNKYNNKVVLDAPEDSNDFAQLDAYDLELKKSNYDLIFAFVLDMDALKEKVTTIIEGNYLCENGYLFLAYPKKGNNMYSTYIHRDDLLTGLGADKDGYVGSSNMKFSRMVSLDETFTVVGLKEDRTGKTRSPNRPRQSVNDYISMIPQIEMDLQNTPKLLAFYQSLTPGYQKEWARFVYSAKQEKTRAKRRGEMKEILAAGYNSRDLYRQNR